MMGPSQSNSAQTIMNLQLEIRTRPTKTLPSTSQCDVMDTSHHVDILLNAITATNAQSPQFPSSHISSPDTMEVIYTSQQQNYGKPSKPQHDHLDHEGLTTGPHFSLMVGSMSP